MQTATKPYVNRLRETPNYPDTTQWKQRHLDAVTLPRNNEVPIVQALRAWLYYADMHRNRYESGIGEDGVLGPAWAQWGDALRQLLNGDCGRLDCGTLDSILCNTLTDEGFDPDKL